MIWFTWRQFRLQAAIAAVVLAALGVLLFITGRSLTDLYSTVAACRVDCATAVDNFLALAMRGGLGRTFNIAMISVYALPVLAGVFWGAPLVARELETGTHRLAWNQTVTRTRWLATKLAIVGAAAAATSGLVTWAVTFWARQIDSAAGNRINPEFYTARGIVPIAYALFAFVLGVTCGTLIRRTLPAMAATLAIYTAVVAAMPLWLRAHLNPMRHQTEALDVESLQAVMVLGNPPETPMTMEVIGAVPPKAWIVTNRIITPNGADFVGGPTDMANCSRPEPGVCKAWLESLNLRHDLAWHPSSHFWGLQWAETGVFVALTALLAGFCFWWLHRRLT